MNLSGPSKSRIGALIALPDVLEELQGQPDQVFRQAGIPLQLFDSPENRVHHEDMCRLLAACVSATGRSDFGLLVGRRFSLENFGPLGELMRSSATVGEALQMLIQHLHQDDRAAVAVMFRPQPSTMFLGYLLNHPAILGSGPLLDAAITVGHRILESLCGPAWHCRSIKFSHRRPENVMPYQRVFGPAVYFDADVTGFNFDASWLERPLPGSDPARWRHMHSTLRKSAADASIGFSEQVLCALYALIAMGGPSAAAVARQFACSERTLRERLQREGTNLQRLLADARFERACHLLRSTEMPVSQIAAALCYADTAVFSRAFHGWAGKSPRRWRAESAEDQRIIAPPDRSRQASLHQP